LILFAAAGAAQDRMADTLRKGIVAEESKHDLNAAIQEYQSAVSQFDEVRQTAATALFRMAECYRKLGKDPQAIEAYRRVIHDFADQTKLADQSRGVLTGTYKTQASSVTPLRDTPAFRQYRASFEAEIALVEKALQAAIKRKNLNETAGDDIDGIQRQLLQLQRDLALVDMGVIGPPTASTRREL
jgi:tetratricopeptide (TPR) repeat protein